MSISQIKQELSLHSSPKKAKISLGFFKTGKGQYGEGDKFIGVTVPDQRKIAKNFKDISLKDLEELIKSKVHEHRLTALLILVEKFTKADPKNRKIIYEFYLKNLPYINNWDLVDLSAPKILGAYLHDKDRKLIHKFAQSKNLWEKRIAIISTYHFIKQKDFKDALKISEVLLKDPHDLIHKACGWMLREIGKMELKTLELFLKKHSMIMPRTMLRYAIEHFSQEKRQTYLKNSTF